jgi:hypothetical protein
MSWTVPPTYPVGSLLTSTLMNRISGNLADLDARSRPSSGGVLTSETTTSTSYADLATVGPFVTLVTGVAAMVVLSALVQTTGAGVTPRMAFAISGATTVPATDTWCINIDSSAVVNAQTSFAVLVTGLNAGSNTFTAKYKVGSGTGTFVDRGLMVWPATNLT